MSINPFEEAAKELCYPSEELYSGLTPYSCNAIVRIDGFYAADWYERLWREEGEYSSLLTRLLQDTSTNNLYNRRLMMLAWAAALWEDGFEHESHS